MSPFWQCQNVIVRRGRYLANTNVLLRKPRYNIRGVGSGYRDYSIEEQFKWIEPEEETAPRPLRTHFVKIAVALDARDIVDPLISLLRHIAPEVGFDPSLVMPRLGIEFALQNVTLTEYATNPEMLEKSISVDVLSEAMESLKAPIRSLRGGDTGPIIIPFGALRPLMHTRRRDYSPRATQRLVIQPSSSPAYDTLLDIIDLMHARFLRKGIVCDARHRYYPATLHATIMKGRTAFSVDGGKTFDLVKLYNHPALDMYRKPNAPIPFEEYMHQQPLELDLGSVRLEGLILDKVVKKGEQRPAPVWQWGF